MSQKTISLPEDFWKGISNKKEESPFKTWEEYLKHLFRIEYLFVHQIGKYFWLVRNSDTLKDKDDDLKRLQELLEGQKLSKLPTGDGLIPKSEVNKINDLWKEIMKLKFSRYQKRYRVENEDYEALEEAIYSDYMVLEKMPIKMATKGGIGKKINEKMDKIMKIMYICCQNKGYISKDAKFTPKSDEEIWKEQEEKEERKRKEKAEEKGYLNVLVITGKPKEQIDKVKLQDLRKEQVKNMKNKYGQDIEVHVYTEREAKEKGIKEEEIDYTIDYSLVL